MRTLSPRASVQLRANLTKIYTELNAFYFLPEVPPFGPIGDAVRGISGVFFDLFGDFPPRKYGVAPTAYPISEDEYLP